jgi:hypothetical protein
MIFAAGRNFLKLPHLALMQHAYHLFSKVLGRQRAFFVVIWYSNETEARLAKDFFTQ